MDGSTAGAWPAELCTTVELARKNLKPSEFSTNANGSETGGSRFLFIGLPPASLRRFVVLELGSPKLCRPVLLLLVVLQAVAPEFRWASPYGDVCLIPVQRETAGAWLTNVGKRRLKLALVWKTEELISSAVALVPSSAAGRAGCPIS